MAFSVRMHRNLKLLGRNSWEKSVFLGKKKWYSPGGSVAKTLCSQCGGSSFDPWSETGYHMLQPRVCLLQLKIPRATVETEDPTCCNYDLVQPNK